MCNMNPRDGCLTHIDLIIRINYIFFQNSSASCMPFPLRTVQCFISLLLHLRFDNLIAVLTVIIVFVFFILIKLNLLSATLPMKIAILQKVVACEQYCLITSLSVGEYVSKFQNLRILHFLVFEKSLRGEGQLSRVKTPLCILCIL